MYNRYIAQPDGTYQKQKHPSRDEPPKSQDTNATTADHRTPTPNSTGTLGDILGRLLPRQLQAEDLIIILLVLLLTGKSEADKNHALLTLALYFFL